MEKNSTAKDDRDDLTSLDEGEDPDYLDHHDDDADLYDHEEEEGMGSSVSTSDGSVLGSPTLSRLDAINDSKAQKRVLQRKRQERAAEPEETARRHRAHMFVPPGKVRGLEQQQQQPVGQGAVLFTCRNCGCQEAYMKKCGGGCKGHYLCSEACQLDDWHANGHKRECLRGGSSVGKGQF